MPPSRLEPSLASLGSASPLTVGSRYSLAGDGLAETFEQAFEVRHPFAEQAHLLALSVDALAEVLASGVDALAEVLAPGVDVLAEVLALGAHLLTLAAHLLTQTPERRADRDQNRDGGHDDLSRR